MKIISHFILLIGISLLLHDGLRAQTSVQGRIVDAQGAPLAFANILLLTAADSTFVQGQVADEQGSFRFTGLEPITYQCQVSMVGYPTGQSLPFQLEK